MKQRVVGEGTGQPHTVWLTAEQGKPVIFITQNPFIQDANYGQSKMILTDF